MPVAPIRPCHEVSSDIPALVCHRCTCRQDVQLCDSASLIALQGWVSASLPPRGEAPEAASMQPLLDVILAHVPAPAAAPAEQPFAMVSPTAVSRDVLLL